MHGDNRFMHHAYRSHGTYTLCRMENPGRVHCPPVPLVLYVETFGKRRRARGMNNPCQASGRDFVWIFCAGKPEAAGHLRTAR